MKSPLILIIEDNEDVRQNTAELLEVANYRVIVASNGREGVRLSISEKPDLILCDIIMPELDGYAVLHILSKKVETAHLPFIFLTAKAEKPDVRKGMSLGADDYLVKPCDETVLLEAIEARLKKNALLRSYDVSPLGIANFLDGARKTLLQNGLGKDNEPRTLKKKTIIFAEGDAPQHLYFVKSGSIKTIRTHPDGKELIMNIYKANDFFGFEPLLEGGLHSDTAIVMKDCEVIPIASHDFLTLIQSNPAAAFSFISLLCKKLEEKELRLLNLAYNSVRQRTAEALLKLWEENEKTMSISRDDLAKVAGTVSESVIRVLSDFCNEKLIAIDNAKITILKPDGIKKIVRRHTAHD